MAAARSLIALLLLHPALAQQAQPESLPAVEGRAVNAVTGEPVGRAHLVLTPDGLEGAAAIGRSHSVYSDSSGRFAIRNVEPGKYRLRAARNGFLTRDHGAPLDVQQALKDIEIRLTPHGVIAGRIFDMDGEPLASAQVQLLRPRYVHGRKVLTTTRNAFTNDLGEYRWAGLEPGKYYVYAENRGELPAGGMAEEDYVPAYYPGAPDAIAAVPVDVRAGTEVRGIDVMLMRARTATVRGRVVVARDDLSGVPTVRFAAGAQHNDRGAVSFRTPPAKVNAAGEFEIRSLTPGRYTVIAELAKAGRGYAGFTELVVTGTDMEGVVVTIGGGATVTGRVREEGEAKRALGGVRVRLLPGGPASDPDAGDAVRTAEDGTFRLDELHPARYGIGVSGMPDGFYLKSVRAGETDVTYSGIDLKSGVPTHLDIVVSPKAGAVSGAVLDPVTNQPASGATVVLVPREGARAGIAACYPQATSDRQGRFTVKNVVPGKYDVYAWENVEPTAWMDPDFMKPLNGKGQSVEVEESGHVSVQVKLIPAAAGTLS